MPAGIKYDLKGQEVEKELYNVKTGYRLAGGFNLEDNDIAEGTYVPVLTVRKAQPFQPSTLPMSITTPLPCQLPLTG